MPTQFIDDDFVLVRREPSSRSDRLTTLAFGDEVEVLPNQSHSRWTEIRVANFLHGRIPGFVRNDVALRDAGVLRMSMVDVQQGDGLILETPEGKIVFIDGGDNKLFARHAAARFRYRGATEDEPLEVDAIVITHGDADHFDGLNDIRRSEDLPESHAHKRLFIHPRRVYHNGLVKSPSRRQGVRVPDAERFGRTVADNDDLFVIDLYDDPRHAPPEALGAAFERWTKTVDHWEQRGPIDVRRIAFGADEDTLFDFLHDEGIEIELQGPFTEDVTDPDTGQAVPALPFFSKPKKSAVLHLEQGGASGTPSASHTINGHSITFRLTYGNVRFAFTGDQNQESMDKLCDRVGADNLEAEIVKVPHHGSHDFDFDALKAMSPVVALISSGDEDVFHEHIHPRATLLAALGKVMRLDTGVIFNTELAAFFHKRDYSHDRETLEAFFKGQDATAMTREEIVDYFVGKVADRDPDSFYAFERTNFGIIHVRTDGTRVLAFTHSGKEGVNEAYRFTVEVENGEHVVEFADDVTTR